MTKLYVFIFLLAMSIFSIFSVFKRKPKVYQIVNHKDWTADDIYQVATDCDYIVAFAEQSLGADYKELLKYFAEVMVALKNSPSMFKYEYKLTPKAIEFELLYFMILNFVETDEKYGEEWVENFFEKESFRPDFAIMVMYQEFKEKYHMMEPYSEIERRVRFFLWKLLGDKDFVEYGFNKKMPLKALKSKIRELASTRPGMSFVLEFLAMRLVYPREWIRTENIILTPPKGKNEKQETK